MTIDRVQSMVILDLTETQLVIEHGVTLGGYTMHEHLEALHHAEAYAQRLTWCAPLRRSTRRRSRHLHALALRELVDAPAHCSSAARSIAHHITVRCHSSCAI